MPSINIYDNDYTGARADLATSFSVVVFGGVTHPTEFNEIADTNGVCEVVKSDTALFNKFKAAVGIGSDGDSGSSTFKYSTAKVLNESATGLARVKWEAETGTGKAEADAQFVNFFNKYPGLVYALDNGSSAVPDPTEAAEYISIDTTPTTYYKITKVDDALTEVVKADFANTNYIVLDTLGINKDTVELDESVGKQIAYELLEAGFTVLYKQITSITDITSGELGFLEDKSTYNFRFLTSGFYKHATEGNPAPENILGAYSALVRIAGVRKDCIALLDVDDTEYSAEGMSQATAIINAKAWVSNLGNVFGSDHRDRYAALFTPAVVYPEGGLITHNTTYGFSNRTLPASFHYLLCFANAMQSNFAEWFATAGEERGVCGYAIDKTTVDFGINAANELEPRKVEELTRAVNVITKFRRNYVLWGNRTAYAIQVNQKLTASHFLNIRQLVSTVSQTLFSACMRYSFDPNSQILWVNFCSAISPTLELMKANEGITDYKLLKVATTEKGEFKARVRIIPIEAVEDFDIEIALEDNFSEASIEELTTANA